MLIRYILKISIVMCGTLSMSSAWAELAEEVVTADTVVEINQAPRDAVVATVNGLVERLKVGQNPENGAYLHQVVEEQLVPFVDFRRITRLVMDKYFKSATTEQRNYPRF